MLIVNIPANETRGVCKINARPCDFEIKGNEFRFRCQDDQSREWDSRVIVERISEPDIGCIKYVCGNAVAK